MSEKVKYVQFECAQCGEKDQGKFFDNESIPSVINCWSCHAGQGIPNQGDAIVRRQGMFQVQPTLPN